MRKRYVGAIIILIVFCTFLFFLTRFSSATILATEGYFISEDIIDEVLFSDKKNVKTGNIKLEKVSYDDPFYTNLGKLYVGEEKKILVNDVYPVFSNNGSAIVNLDSKAKLINDKFEFFDSYENFTLTDGKLYNYGDSVQADYENYMFLQLANFTYVNLQSMTLRTLTHEYVIPVNSIINFEKDYLKYYYYDKTGKLIYDYIDGIGLDSTISIGNRNFTYENLLVKIEKISNDDTNILLDGDSLEDEYIIDSKDDNNNSSDDGYEKPTVSVEDFVANVYSVKSKLSISDPSKVIIGGINFQFKVGNKIFLRKTLISSGNFEITGLVPDTEFTIIGSYKYYNKENKKMEVTFFEQKITTQGVDKLEPIDLAFSNGPIYSNKLQVDKLKIISSLDSETLKGVKRVVIDINGESYNISSNLLIKLLNGTELTYVSPDRLGSNQVVNYTFKFLDAFNNEIKIVNADGVSRTAKSIPKATFKITKSEVNVTEFKVSLKNDDQVKINSYRYVIYDKNMAIVSENALDSDKETQEVVLNSLDPDTTYTVKILGDFDIEDGNGVVKDNVIGEGMFTTLPLSSLGFLRLTSDVTEMTSNSTKLSSSIDLDIVSPILLDLLNSFTVRIYDEADEIVYEKTYEGLELEPVRAGLEFIEDITGLNSATEYKIEFVSYVAQGSVKESISVLSSINSFKTYKSDALVNIINKYVSGNMIDFDVQITDPDGAVESDRVLLEVRDSSERLIAMESLNINGEYQRLVYEKLKPNSKYSFIYRVEKYNIGYDNSTYESDYILFSETIVTEEGIYGSIDMVGLLRQIDGNNLFDITDYDRIRQDGSTVSKEYDLKANTVTFVAKNGYANFSYFLPEACLSHVKISFYAKYADDTANMAPVYIGNGSGQNLDYELIDLNKKWKKYEFSLFMNTNYIGFVIDELVDQNKKTSVSFKDIQILKDDTSLYDVTDVATSYHETGYKFTDAIMYSGNQKMPSQYGGEDIGNYGDGFARITNKNTKEVSTFTYTGSSQLFTVPNSGEYLIELWGAGGGDYTGTAGKDQSVSSHGGRGAYTSGVIKLNKNTNLYIYVGGKGTYGSGTNIYGGPIGGYNGGGAGGNHASGSGGGATDVRLKNGIWDDMASLKSRIMVAAGGGGSDNKSSVLHGNDDGSGGAGGSLTSSGAYINGVLDRSYFASQSSGYKFGIGASALASVNIDTGGAGGGYFGGVTTNHGAGGASGGSSYISGYKGCIAYHKVFSDSNKYESYSEKSQYLGTLNVSLYDTRDEITTDDYYIRIYINDKLQKSFRYDLIDNKIENVEKEYEFLKDKKYVVKLSVKIRDRFYDIDSVEFNTNSEIRAIRTVSEFFKIHPNGKYVVLNDLDFTTINTVYTPIFSGEIDFLGHKATRSVQGKGSYIIRTIGSGAKVSNLVMDLKLDNKSSRSWVYNICENNYGIIDNLMINIVEATDVPNFSMAAAVGTNYGTIQNFVVNSKVPVYAQAAFSLLVWSNRGTIKNGYVYGENIKAYYEISGRAKDVSVIAGETASNSLIENVFSLVSVEKNSQASTESSVGNIIGYSSSGTLRNIYSVEDPNKINTNILNHDPNIGSVNSITTKNLFYVSDKNYNSEYSTKISKMALYDTNFQNKVLNSHSGFLVDSFVSLGYYPQVDMNDCMPNQEWLELPKVTDTDLVDITSAEVISNNGDSAEVVLNLNNPGAEKITKIDIMDIKNVEILSQEDDWGKTVLKIRVSEPMKYTSKYYVRSMMISGSLGFEYEKTYGQYERGIDIDLYFPIKNLNDWKLINEIPNQNYILKADLDFKDTAISKYVINNNFSGKFNGNGYKVKNITISGNNAMFYSLTGTIENLYIENYKKTNVSVYGGFIYHASSGAVIDSVHMSNVSVAANSDLGGIVGRAEYITIKNSSVTGFNNVTVADRKAISIGGIIGYAVNTLIQNCYAQDVDINITDSLSTTGVGGIVGNMVSGSMENVYATGKIRVNSMHVGGIVGNSGAKITNAWSNVDIATELDFVGGIVGKTSVSEISNTLVVGPVFSNYNGFNIHRTSGNTLKSSQNNYAWDKQKIYSTITNNVSAEELLTKEQLIDVNTYYDLLNFGEQFDYSNIINGSLPKLKNCDTDEILPNQKDSILITEEFDVIDVQIDKSDFNKAKVRLEIDNPNNLQITEIEFDYLDITKFKIDTENGVSILELDVTPNRYYDSYTLTKIKYVNSNGVNKTYDKCVRVNVQFYKIISKFEDWQQISKTTAENYLLTASIDFSDKVNINYYVSIGRLEGQISSDGQIPTLKNITLNSNSEGISFIKKVTSSLKNINFDNISINSKFGNFASVIQMNFADISDVSFSNINLNAPFANYVAPIGNHSGTDIRNISISNNNIIGQSYVGGLIGSSINSDSYNISAADCTVYGKGNYIGGVMGNKDYTNVSNSFQYTANNMNVTGKGSVGGIFGSGGANYVTITNSTITALSGGSNIGGVAGKNAILDGEFYEVRNCEIIAEGNNYVGGVIGTGINLYDAYVYDTTVTQKGSDNSYTGGIVGYTNRVTYRSIGIKDSEVISFGNATGGIAGYGSVYLDTSYVYNVKVTGASKVGGVVGEAVSSKIYYNITNVNVTATGNHSGGIFGYIVNSGDSGSSYSTFSANTILANSSISGKNYVGGYTGYASAQLTDEYYYNSILVSNVSSQMSGAFIGMITPFDNTYSDFVSRVYLYEKNLINNDVIKDIDEYNNIFGNNMITANDLATKSFYTSNFSSSIQWDYSWLNNGYYPKVRKIVGQQSELIGEQSDIQLPMDIVTYGLRSSISLVDHELPTVTAYTSGVNTVNFEFSDVDKYSYFEVYENNVKIFEESIVNRNYTINYNYKSDLKIVISDGVNRRIKVYKATDLVNLVTTFSDKYAYIYDGQLKGNVSSAKGKFIHVYKDKALTDDLKIYDLNKGIFISENNVFKVSLLSDVVPLFEFSLDDVKIDTYANYSIIHKRDSDILYDKQLFIKDGTVEIVDSSLDSKKSSVIVDEYAKDNYVTILGNDGVIYNLKKDIVFPVDFVNKNIKYMSNNIESKSSIVVVMYNNGKVVLFDYRTGDLVKEEKASADISIVDYFKENLSYRKSILDDNVNSNYKEALELKKLLEKSPITIDAKGNYVVSDSVSGNDDNRDEIKNDKFSSYVTYYNAVTDRFDVLDVSQFIIDDNENFVTENDKIYTSANLVDYYMNESIFEKVFGNINVIVIFVLILLGIIIAMVLWFMNIRKLKMSEEI